LQIVSHFFKFPSATKHFQDIEYSLLKINLRFTINKTNIQKIKTKKEKIKTKFHLSKTNSSYAENLFLKDNKEKAQTHKAFGLLSFQTLGFIT
jgi:hypothetical protein